MAAILQLLKSPYLSNKKYSILIKFGTQQHICNLMTVTWQSTKFLKFKMADGRH